MKNEIKLLIFDIDGTLIPRGSRVIEPSALQAIKEQEARGIKTLIATGRTIYFMHEDIKKSLRSDFYVTVNGQCILDKNCRILNEHHIEENTAKAIIQDCIDNKIAFSLKYDEAIMCYNRFDDYCRIYLKDEPNKAVVVDKSAERNYHIHHGAPMAIFMIGEESVIWSIIKKYDTISSARAYPGAVESYHRDYNKSTGIEEVLKLMNLSWDNCMAFGDADNDIEMLQKAAIGVAMGNASEALKKEADYITTEVTDDGIANAIHHFLD